jgi:hypothetical protein
LLSLGLTHAMPAAEHHAHQLDSVHIPIVALAVAARSPNRLEP